MKTYCVKQKKDTSCVSGSETIRTAKNGRPMMSCICSECGITKTQFISGQSGGALKRDFACGRDLQGKRPGTKQECFKTGRIGYWGLNQLDDGEIDNLLRDRKIERNRKARERRQAKAPKPQMSAEKQQQYIDEIVADIKKETAQRRSTETPKNVKIVSDIKKGNSKNSKKPRMSAEKQQQYIDEIVADIKKETTQRRSNKPQKRKFDFFWDISPEERKRRIMKYLNEPRDAKIMSNIQKFLNKFAKKPIGESMERDGFILTKKSNDLYHLDYPYTNSLGHTFMNNIITTSPKKMKDHLYMIDTGLYVINDLGIPASIV